MSWKTVALGDVCTIVNGGTPKSEVLDYWDGNLNWITPKEMGKLNSREVFTTERKITENGLKNSSAKLLPVNSVILSSRAPIGHLAINKELMATNQGCKGLVPSSSLNYEYLYYFLSYSKKLLNDMGSGATFKELSGSKLATVEIPLPPLATQQKIVAKLDAIFAEIDKATAAAEANSKNAEALFQSCLNKVFESGGDGWSFKELPSLCTLFNGRAYSKNELLDSGKYTVLRVGNFFTNEHWYYSNLELEDNKYCDNGDLLYAWSASFGPRIWGGDKVIYHYHIWKIVPNEDVVDKMFLYYLLEWDVDKIKSDHGTGATMIHVSKKSMESRVLPYVDMKRQKNIVLRLDALKSHSDSLKQHYQKKAKEIDAYKNSILKQAFSGELVKE